MTCEDDFQAALDHTPKDWQARLVFADWLDERGDERADGYRALGRWRRVPQVYSLDVGGCFWVCCPDSTWFKWQHRLFAASLPYNWHSRMREAQLTDEFPSRRLAEDAAARAYCRLVADLRSRMPRTPDLLPRFATGSFDSAVT